MLRPMWQSSTRSINPLSTDTVTVENHRIRAYVSGVGTKSGKEDDAWAMGHRYGGSEGF
ncbi:MAG: hypothetical protein MH208_01790 [Marinobacter sp.]|nr:hypothetical protein [Marinobacter sp.]